MSATTGKDRKWKVDLSESSELVQEKKEEVDEEATDGTHTPAETGVKSEGKERRSWHSQVDEEEEKEKEEAWKRGIIEGLMGSREKMLDIRNEKQENVGNLIIGRAQYENDLEVEKIRELKSLVSERRLAMEELQVKHFKEINDVNVKHVREINELEEKFGKRFVVAEGEANIRGNVARAAVEARIMDELERASIKKDETMEELVAIGISKSADEVLEDGNFGGFSDDRKYQNTPVEMRTIVEKGVDSNQDFMEGFFSRSRGLEKCGRPRAYQEGK